MCERAVGRYLRSQRFTTPGAIALRRHLAIQPRDPGLEALAAAAGQLDRLS
jgi:hypothetical protein